MAKIEVYELLNSDILDRDTEDLTIEETESYIKEIEEFIAMAESASEENYELSEEFEEIISQAEDTIFYLQSLLKIKKSN